MNEMFDQIHSVVEIIRTAYLKRQHLAGIDQETFERLYPALAKHDVYTCEHFLQRLFDDI